MPRNSSSESSILSLSEARTFGALVGSLLLLGASFILLVLAPQILARFHAAASETVPSGGFLPIAAASGIALGGGAAMIAVMARLVRDIEIRPYACLAPVLAVFTGYVMWGLRAQLPLESVSTEYVGVFALAVSVAGGSLVAQRSGGARAIGWTLALFAPLVLVGLIWASAGQGSVGEVISGLTSQVKMYLALLIGTGFALGLIGEGARVLAWRSAADRFVVPGGGTLSYGASASYEGPASQSYGHSAPIEEERLFDPPRQQRVEPEPQAYQPPPMRFDIPAERPPRVNVWEFEQDELTVPKRGLPWATIFLLLALAGGGAGAYYYGVYMPKQQKEQAALQALQTQQDQVKAVEAQQEAQQRAVESKDAAARLEAAIGTQGKQAVDKAAVEQKPAAPAAETKKPAAAPAAKAAPAPAASKPVAATPATKRPEPARKPVEADKEDGPTKGLSEGKGNSDPIYGL